MKKIYLLLFICNSLLSFHAQNKKELNASILRLKSDSTEMSNTIEEKKRIISKNTTKIEELQSLNKSNSLEIDNLNNIISAKEKLIANNEKLISYKNIIIDSLDIFIDSLEKDICPLEINWKTIQMEEGSFELKIPYLVFNDKKLSASINNQIFPIINMYGDIGYEGFGITAYLSKLISNKYYVFALYFFDGGFNLYECEIKIYYNPKTKKFDNSFTPSFSVMKFLDDPDREH